ncbi:MAG TPA: penicillin acylase family protein [Myxococcota bacterium]|nr:penicillin acylase family protein [Myxococcota bacterium]
MLVVLAGLAATWPSAALGAARTVREPAYGLPHIWADTDLELARENGREIAKDRLGQIILLARVGRGTIFQVFGPVLPETIDLDFEARFTGYTSSELNSMWAHLPARERELVLEYCKGVNDAIEAVYAKALPEPIEVGVLRTFGFGADLFGNATNVSDQVDPFYVPPGGADPDRPLAGFQFTPELAMAIAVLQVRNFGFAGFDETARFGELQALVAKHGDETGTQIWSDLNFAVDPLAPTTVPDPTTPGFGVALAQPKATTALAKLAKSFPRYAWLEGVRRRETRQEARAALARRLGAWPMLGSYAWAISAAKSATGHPWVGGFPQTGIQTPSIMHFAENRTRQGIAGVGMEFVGAPFVLIGHTDHVAYTTTTAQLPVVDTFFEAIVGEAGDALRYLDEGTPAPLSSRVEIIRAAGGDIHLDLWRSHARGGNAGSRPVIDFLGDAEGTADGGSPTTLVHAGAFDVGFAGGFVAIVEGPGKGQIRAIAGVPDPGTLTVATAWTTPPLAGGSVYVAVRAGNEIVAAAIDSAVWLEEGTAASGFAYFQRARSLADIRAGVRLIPSTHNFLAADNRGWNRVGARSRFGNIGYWSSGLSRVRQGGQDPRLPLDGAGPNPLVVASGVVEKAKRTSLKAPGAFQGLDLAPPPPNQRYDHPGEPATEFIVSITNGVGAKQTRRIRKGSGSRLRVEHPWGVVPAPGDAFEVYEVVAMPEAVNPAEGYTANWNNKAARLDPGNGFGRQHRVTFILEALREEDAWDRGSQRRLNADVAGLDGKGRFGQLLVPRLREAVQVAGNGGNPAVDTVLAALETQDAAPELGRFFVDPVADAATAGEVSFLNQLIGRLANAIYGDEFAGALGVPGGSRGLALVQHAIDTALGDLPGAYAQAYAGDYFGGAGWASVVRDAFAGLAANGIPSDGNRGNDRYEHPLDLTGVVDFERTPTGNRGIWEQIVEVGPTVVGEFIFPLGQSGHLEGGIGGVTLPVDPHTESLHPIWRDWRFVPMLAVARDLKRGDSGDRDGDGVLDGFERWHFGNTRVAADADTDGDGLSLLGEFLAGSDPVDPDTDDDGRSDGTDATPQDRLLP